MGRLFAWDFRPMRQVNLSLVALSCLALLLAVRQVRGRSRFADVFLPLLLLSPVHYESYSTYFHANALPFAAWNLAASAVLAGWPVRSVLHLLSYVLVVLCVTWVGGPVGNVWAVGLCAVLVSGWFARKEWSWRMVALLGGGAILASSAVMLSCVPPSVCGGMFLSTSLSMTLEASLKYSTMWLGHSPVVLLQSGAFAVVLLPGLYVGVRLVQDIRDAGSSRRMQFLHKWLGLLGVFLGACAIVLMMGYGRGNYPTWWEPRYAVLLSPLSVSLYLLLVRSAASPVLMNGLALFLAICAGWNLPETLSHGKWLGPKQALLSRELREGRQPLSFLAHEHLQAAGWSPGWGSHSLIEWWKAARDSGISVYRCVHGTEADPARFCLLQKAEDNPLPASLQRMTDKWAMYNRAVEAQSGEASAAATYEIKIPRDGVYKLCCRWLVTDPGQSFAVAVDDSPTIAQPVPGAPEYMPRFFNHPLLLQAGRHRLTITWPGPGSRLDVLELTPW